MCRRFTTRSKPENVAKQFDAKLVDKYPPEAIFSPTDLVPMIVQPRNQAQRELRTARFGIIPSFAMDPAVGKKMYNCRSETIDIKPSFRPAFEARRAIIPATGFFEWHLHNKEPHLITPEKSKFFAFAAIWDRWRDPVSDEVVVSCSIVTTEAAGPLASIHQRMPVILSDDAQDAWLNTKTTPEALKALLKPSAAIRIEYSDEVMVA